MKFTKSLVPGKLIKRYKRFLTDVLLDTGEQVIAHCTNSGTMQSCIEEGAEVLLSEVNDPNRKTRFTWEMIKIDGSWVGINTSIPNLLVFDAVCNQEIKELKGYTHVVREVTWGDSRFDVMATNERETCFIEVKNVTLKLGNMACFPDAITTRGRKHLETLINVKKSGLRAVMFYVVQRTDVNGFAPADTIDPEYGVTLRKAFREGVEILVYVAQVTPDGISLIHKLPVSL